MEHAFNLLFFIAALETIRGVAAFIFILGTAVVIHEFGHFAVGKLLGIRVETFSVGFGPRIFGRRYGTTDYRLSLIPLGGYVKFGGDESNAAIEGESSSDIPEHERFDIRPRWHKFLVIIAGPLMNILTALAVVFIAALMYGIPQAPSSPVVARVTEGGSAASAGLRPGDRIVQFHGKENPTWDRILNDAAISPEQPLPLVVERDGNRVPLTIRPAKQIQQGEAIGVLDFRVDMGGAPVVVADVTEGFPAVQAGVQAGDQLVAINGEPIADPQEVSRAIQAGKDAPIRITINRDGEQKELTANARIDADGVARIGVEPAVKVPLEEASLGGAVAYAFNRNIEIVRLTGNAIGQIFTGKRSARDTLSGPIGIGRAASRAADEGWGSVFGLLGFLSLNLGIINLLPIPVLDGGAIALLGLEFMLGVAGITLSMAVRERIQQVGFVMLILLMGFVITNDLVKIAVG